VKICEPLEMEFNVGFLHFFALLDCSWHSHGYEDQ